MPTYPNAQSISGLEQLLTRLRRTFPEKVDAGVLKQYGIAPKNETFVLNALKFIGVLDEGNARTERGRDALVKNGDEFNEAFGSLVEEAYKPLFELYSEEAWTLGRDRLMQFFRNADKSSEVVGKRQADTFAKFAEIADQREAGAGAGETKSTSSNTSRREPKSKAVKEKPTEVTVDKSPSGGKGDGAGGSDVSLAVRIEVILPQTTDQATYDAIFRSIRENLISRE